MNKRSQINKNEIIFLIKIMLTYTVLAGGFSIIGILLPEKNILPNPFYNGSFSLIEVGGHIIFGLVVGIASLSLRYILLCGAFAVLIDADHFINLLNIDAVSRMSHSLSFGFLSIIVMMFLHGRKDYLLGASALAGVVSHISYDSFYQDDPGPPFFAPFYNRSIPFHNLDWLYLEIAAIIIIGIVSLFTSRNSLKTVDT